jgi:hypothetical protein
MNISSDCKGATINFGNVILTGLAALLAWGASAETLGFSATSPTPDRGPLRVHAENPRYFTDGTKLADGSLKAVYLTGSHTWPNLIDRGPSDPPPVFDFDGYLDLLQQHDHNFIRLWSRHVTWYHGYGEGELHASPLAWERTGPGKALDGKPKFDLARFHQPYFDRLRARVSAARDRGIYAGVMLFGGNYECMGGWQGNPFHAQNNINGIDGDPARQGHGLKTHTLEVPAINRLQEAYLRKVIDTLNDLDNVLYEISNEGHSSSLEWQKHWIRFDPGYTASRRAMGQTRRLAERMNLARMIPRNDLSSTGFCLANPGHEYLVYQPAPGAKFTLQLKPGNYQFEWFNPVDGKTAAAGQIKIETGASQFKAPFENDAVLYLNSK